MDIAQPASRYLLGGIPWYSILIVCGMAIAILLAIREEKRLKLPQDTVVDLALWLIPMGILGARIYYVIFSWDYFAAAPQEIFAIWHGGLAIYGGVMGGAVACLIVSRRKKLSFLTLADIVAPGLLLAQAIGRWGNYFNMECYGEQIFDPAYQMFPFAVAITENGVVTWHMATFFYESLWNLLGFAALMALRKRTSKTGDVFLWYLLIYGAGRAFIEGLRTDSLYAAGGLRVSQWLSVLLCIAPLMVWLARGKAGEASLRLCLAGAWVGIAGALTAVGLSLLSATLSSLYFYLPFPAVSVILFGCSEGKISLRNALCCLPPLAAALVHFLLPGGFWHDEFPLFLYLISLITIGWYIYPHTNGIKMEEA